MAKDEDEDPLLSDESIKTLQERFNMETNPKALQDFMTFAENMEKTTRIRAGIVLLLVQARHNDMKALPQNTFIELMRRSIATYAWAIRAEAVATLRQHVIQHEELDFDLNLKEVNSKLDASLLELGQYIDFVSEPTVEQKAKPQ